MWYKASGLGAWKILNGLNWRQWIVHWIVHSEGIRVNEERYIDFGARLHNH